jgi:septal ring factor EnvC (AmiA/AmiB activator)
MGFISMEKKLIFLMTVFLLQTVSLYPQKMYNENKTKLDNIKAQIEKKNKELENYVEKYEKILIDINKIKTSNKNIDEKKKVLNNTLIKLQEQIKETKLKYDLLKQDYNELLKEINSDMTSLYLSRFQNSYFYDTNQIVMDIIKRNIIIEKSNFAKAIDYKTKIFSNSLTELSENKNKYSKAISRAENELKKNQKQLKLSQKELLSTNKRLTKLRAEIDELNKSANELNNLMKKIEKSSPYKKNMSEKIPIPKNSLPWPVKGEIVKKFGREYVEDLKTWLINDGIRIKSSVVSDVRPVMNGKVVYSGKFRGFGNVVIVDHGNNIYSTYGFMDSIYVSNGVAVNETTVIGRTGSDLRNIDGKIDNVLYFEIRNGEDALNPVDYLK